MTNERNDGMERHGTGWDDARATEHERGVGDAARNARADTFPLLGLAPMEGVGDLPLRLWVSQTSAPAFAVTPFLRVTRDYPLRRVPATYAAETTVLRGAVNYELVPQLMGSSAGDLVRIAEGLLESTPFIDFNCGCPSPTVVGHGAGSGLLESPTVFDSFVGGLARALGASRMSIKMRTGFSSGEEFEGLLDVVARHEPRRLTVHGRTRAQRYLGLADWSLIARAARLPVEVVGSGDIVDAPSFAKRRAQFRAGPCIVGRGALRNPFVFAELRGGEAVALSREVLLISLDVYAALQHLYDSAPAELIDAVGGRGLFRGEAGLSVDAWTGLCEHVCQAAGWDPRDPGSWGMARGAFSKVKMLWNSWRSGLPSSFFVPGPLRAACYADFRACVRELALAGPPLIPLGHDPSRDWIYSGGKEGA